MIDLTAKLREALPCLNVSLSGHDRRCGGHDRPAALGGGEPVHHLPHEVNEGHCNWSYPPTPCRCFTCIARAKVEAVVREMVAKVPHLFRGNEPERYLIAAAVCPFPVECARIGGQCAFGGEKGMNNG